MHYVRLMHRPRWWPFIGPRNLFVFCIQQYLSNLWYKLILLGITIAREVLPLESSGTIVRSFCWQ